MEIAKSNSTPKKKLLNSLKNIIINNISLIADYLILNVIFPLLPTIFTLIKSYNSNENLKWELFTNDFLYFGITYNMVLIVQITQLEKSFKNNKIIVMKDLSLLATTLCTYLIGLNGIKILKEEIVISIFIILILLVIYGTSTYIFIKKDQQGGV